MDFVLDNSVAMRWLLQDGSAVNQRYAADVLASLAQHTAAVPSLWWLEVSNVIAKAERKGAVKPAESEEFLSLLALQPIQENTLKGALLLGKTLALARQHGVSSYDATYLVLCMQLHLPLATLDAPLRAAATHLGVGLYLQPDSTLKT